MYPLSTFSMLVDLSNKDITNTFVLDEDYIVNGKSVYIVLSSSKWDNVAKVYTSPVSALDFISASVDTLSSLMLFSLGPNQPYLSGSDRYFYKVASEYGFLSGYGFNGENLFILDPVYFCTITNSPFNSSGNIIIDSKEIRSLYIYNCSITGIFISQNVSVSSLSNIYFGSTYLIKSSGIFENFLSILAETGPNNGNIYQMDNLGYNNDNSENFDPFLFLDFQGLTAIDSLTGTKGWVLNKGY